MQIVTDNEKLKGLFKQAIIEVMEERKDLVHEILIEAIEDAGMIDAIREGEKTGTVTRSEVFEILEGKA
jgi:hypothetical protein